MLQAVFGEQGQGMPPSSNTGAEVTGRVVAGVHWMTGVVLPDASETVEVDTVLGFLVGELKESVELLDWAGMGYTDGFKVGPVRVLNHPDRPEMGVCVIADGTACEELGLNRIAAIQTGLQLRVSRFDIAFDNCEFTPAMLRDEWRSDRVRTRAKVPENARSDRQWRTSDWRENAEGDTFSMGSRTSNQFARCYDRRGAVRFELELKGEAAAAAAMGLLGLVAIGQGDLFGREAMGWVRRFVDFVDPTSDTNTSRQTLAPFWETFVAGADKAILQLEGVVTRTLEDMQRWVERQVAPVLAALNLAFGTAELKRLAGLGVPRMKGRHWEALRVHLPGGLVAAT